MIKSCLSAEAMKASSYKRNGFFCVGGVFIYLFVYISLKYRIIHGHCAFFFVVEKAEYGIIGKCDAQTCLVGCSLIYPSL